MRISNFKKWLVFTDPFSNVRHTPQFSPISVTQPRFLQCPSHSPDFSTPYISPMSVTPPDKERKRNEKERKRKGTKKIRNKQTRKGIRMKEGRKERKKERSICRPQPAVFAGHSRQCLPATAGSICRPQPALFGK